MDHRTSRLPIASAGSRAGRHLFSHNIEAWIWPPLNRRDASIRQCLPHLLEGLRMIEGGREHLEGIVDCPIVALPDSIG